MLPSWLSRNCTALRLPILIEAISVQSLQTSPQSTQGVCWPQNTRKGKFVYQSPNMCHILPCLFSLLNPTDCITNLILECLFFLTLLTNIKLRLQIQVNKKYTILYFINLYFYLETHFFHRVSGKLEHNLIYSFLSLWGAWESVPWFKNRTSLIFKHSLTQITTKTTSAPSYVTPCNLLTRSCFQEHLKHRTLLGVPMDLSYSNITHSLLPSQRFFPCSQLLLTAEASVPTTHGLARAVLFSPSGLRHISLVLRAWVQLYLLFVSQDILPNLLILSPLWSFWKTNR